MKKYLKKYKVFLVLLTINILFLFWEPNIVITSFKNILSYLLEMVAVLPPIFILLGLLDVWVEKEVMMKYMGKDAGMKGVLLAFFLGSVAAGPLYAAFPVAIMMLKKRASIFNIFIFIGAWSTTKIPMLSFEATNMGFPFTLARLVLSIIGIICIAAIIDKSLSEKEKQEIYELHDEEKIKMKMKLKMNK